MSKFNRFAFTLLVLLSMVVAEEIERTSKVESVSLFKNGLALVKRNFTVTKPGTYLIKEVPIPIHGTFWIESDAEVITRVTKQEVEVPFSASFNFQKDLVGKTVDIYFVQKDIPFLSGEIVALQAAPQENWNRNYQQPRSFYSYYPQNYGIPVATNPQFLLIKTSDRLVYVDTSKIAQLGIRDTKISTKQMRPVLLFTVKEIPNEKATISITYLTKGMAWAPSYLVDISNRAELTLHQKAVLKNELGDLKETQIFLISGFPSVQFANVTSPLSLKTNWTKFFQELNQKHSSSHASTSNVLSQQAVSLNRASPSSTRDFSATPQGEGVDMHYQPIGMFSLNEGDSLALTVAKEKASYERIVEWIIPDTRSADGRYVQEYQRNQNPEKYQDALWDAIRFKNPFSFPLTTGPAMIVSQGKFNGQRLSYWVNTGEETTLQITKALSIRSRHLEFEEEGKREIIHIGGRRFQKTVVKGSLLLNNHRKEATKVLIRRRFSGELISADRSPTSELLEEGVYSVNKRNQLKWSVSLQPGEEVQLKYRYSVLVPY